MTSRIALEATTILKVHETFVSTHFIELFQIWTKMQKL